MTSVTANSLSGLHDDDNGYDDDDDDRFQFDKYRLSCFNTTGAAY